MAKIFLSIQAGSEESERIFSKAGNIMNSKRSCLGSKNLDMMIFISHN